MRTIGSRSARGRATAVVVALTLAGLVPPPAGAQSAGGCRLTGSATFAPGLTYMGNTVGAMSSFRFSGTVSLCAAGPSSGPTAGSVSIGNPITDTATGYKWQEPLGSAQGGCGSSTTRAHAIVRWGDGTVTVIDQATVSVSGQVLLSGEVVDRLVLAPVDQQAGQPMVYELMTTRYAGGTVAGELNVTGPPTAVLSCATSGLATLTLDGAVGLGTA